ncbi:MAG: DUF4440 domain-containing protein [Pseudomonadota bacterium]
MKHIVSMAAIMAAMSGVAMAADYNMACAKPGDDRVIEIVSPGQVGQACDVRYTREAGANVSVPYHADNAEAFCLEKAAELVANLRDAGYACAPVVTPIVAEAAPALETPPQPVARNIDEVMIEQPPVSEPVLAEAPEDPAALEEKMSLILGDEPQTSAAVAEPQAVRGPAQLTTQALEPVTPAPAAASSSSVGRMVGAEPQEPAVIAAGPSGGVTPVTQAALQESEEPAPAPQPVEAAPVKTQAPEAAPEPRPAKKAEAPARPRTAEEIILASLNAQVAAWNEGNLDAFMETYWKSDKLKFVSGNKVTQGWSATQKKYRERHGDNDGDLGRLSLDKTDFVQITDDVGVVTGRFNLVKDGASNAGAFSLVMKRVDGMWRIAHDHSTEDPKPVQ